METSKFGYERNNHSVGDSIWHLEWCSKYRYEMFRKFEYKSLAEACVRKAAHEHGIQIIVISVMPEHLHCIVKIPLTMTPARALQLFKGKSAYLFFRAHPKARLRYPKGHLWRLHPTSGRTPQFNLHLNLYQRKLHTLVWRGGHAY